MLKKLFKNLGPGSLIAAAFIGPGTVTLCTLAGVKFGMSLLWTLLIAVLASITLQSMAVKIGIIGKKSITEAKYVIGMQDASYFKGNEMMNAMRAGNIDKLDMHAGEGTITFTANNPGEAQRNAEKAIKDYINKETRNDRNALFAFNDLELEQVDNDGPTRQQEQSIKRVLDKYSNKAMFNTPSGKASGPLQKFADDESLGDMAISGVM